jgi:hypothetical protein
MVGPLGRSTARPVGKPVEKATEKPADRPATRLLVMAGILLAALAILAVLMFNTRPTVVEIHLVLDEVVLDLLPPALAGGDDLASSPAPALLVTFEPLADSLTTPSLKVRRADHVKATVDGRERWLRPLPEGTIDLRAQHEPMQLRLALRGAVSAGFQAARRLGGGARVTLDLDPGRSVATEEGRAASPVRLEIGHSELSLALDRVRVSDPHGLEPRLAEQEVHPVPAGSPHLVVQGAPREPCQVSLTVEPGTGPGATMRVLDPASGEVSPERRIDLPLSEPRMVSWNDRLVVLEPDAGMPATPLLRPGLPVDDIELWRLPKGEPVSFVQGGSIRFPLGEKEKIDIEPGFFLSLESDRPLTLRSLDVAGGRLRMVLWGRPSKLLLGPAPDLQAERLPNLLSWLYTHSPDGLIYTVLAGVATGSFWLLRQLGIFKD